MTLKYRFNSLGQSQTKGPDPGILTDSSSRMHNGPVNDEERKEVLTKLYDHVKNSLQKIRMRLLLDNFLVLL